MKHVAKYRGFTLRELLVVIGVIGLILAVLAPMMHRTSCHNGRNICRNCMKQLALSIWSFEQTHNHYPGFQDSVVDASGQRFSRPLLYMLMPQLERSDIYESFSGNAHPHNGVPGVYLELLVCPTAARDDVTARSGATSHYVYNTGMPDAPSASAPADWPANGVIQNRYLADSLGMVLLDNNSAYVTRWDGTANTVLLSERREFHLWTDTAEYDVGFVWHPRFEKEPWAKFNSKPPNSHAVSKYVLARPSSHHPGVVNAAFCDGHVRTVREGIDYRVYAQLMTPRGGDATYPGLRDAKKVPVEEAFRKHVVHDEDY